MLEHDLLIHVWSGDGSTSFSFGHVALETSSDRGLALEQCLAPDGLVSQEQQAARKNKEGAGMYVSLWAGGRCAGNCKHRYPPDHPEIPENSHFHNASQDKCVEKRPPDRVVKLTLSENAILEMNRKFVMLHQQQPRWHWFGSIGFHSTHIEKQTCCSIVAELLKAGIRNLSPITRSTRHYFWGGVGVLSTATAALKGFNVLTDYSDAVHPWDNGMNLMGAVVVSISASLVTALISKISVKQATITPHDILVIAEELDALLRPPVQVAQTVIVHRHH